MIRRLRQYRYRITVDLDVEARCCSHLVQCLSDASLGDVVERGHSVVSTPLSELPGDQQPVSGDEVAVGSRE